MTHDRAAKPTTCWHINLIKQVGPLDDGPAKSTRYRCKECGAFVVTKPYEVEVTIGPGADRPAASQGSLRERALMEACAAICNGCAQGHPLVSDPMFEDHPPLHDWGFTKQECSALKIRALAASQPPQELEGLVREWRARPHRVSIPNKIQQGGNLGGLVQAVRLAVEKCADELEAALIRGEVGQQTVDSSVTKFIEASEQEVRNRETCQ